MKNVKTLAPCLWLKVIVGYGWREVREHPWQTPQLCPGPAVSSILSCCNQETIKPNYSDIANADVC